MRVVFADACYWIAIANPKDQLHAKAMKVNRSIGDMHIFTTDEVLNEFLNFFSGGGDFLRRKSVEYIEAIRNDANVTVVPQTRESFNRGLRLYKMRPDKQYSMADCVSMETMRDQGITDVLTDDHHFEQEGFTILL